jgi:hypothetical protein
MEVEADVGVTFSGVDVGEVGFKEVDALSCVFDSADRKTKRLIQTTIAMATKPYTRFPYRTAFSPIFPLTLVELTPFKTNHQNIFLD